jgi:type IV secretion system protein VirB5
MSQENAGKNSEKNSEKNAEGSAQKINLDANFGQKSDQSYRKALDEWSIRIGGAKSQARNWQLACLASLFIVIVLIIAMIILLSVQKTYVYVAEVKPQENIVNVKPATELYVPSQAQQEYFVANFIKLIMTLSLDPVVARDHWMTAYSFVEGGAIGQLNTYAQKNDPFADIGRMTKVVKIKNFHPLSPNSFNFTWTQTIYDMKGNIKSNVVYNGIFTLVTGKTPATTDDLLENPLGLKIAYFTFSVEGRS